MSEGHCLRRKIPRTARSSFPVLRGFLTGTARRAEELPEGDYRRNDPRMQGDNFAANMQLAGVVQGLAKRKGATASQVALAWVLSRGEDVAPIPGTKRRQYLEENVASVELVLNASELAELDTAFSPGATAGPRYTQAQMSTVDR